MRETCGSEGGEKGCGGRRVGVRVRGGVEGDLFHAARLPADLVVGLLRCRVEPINQY